MLLFSKIFRIPLRSGVEVEQFIVSILLTPSKYIRRSSLSKETNTNKVNAVVIESGQEHAGTSGQTYYSHYPNTSRRSESMHASMTLNNSSCSQETNTCKDLGGDTPRISIQEIRIGLWYPDRYQHGGGRSHTDQGKGSHTSVPAAKLSFYTDNSAKHEADS